MQPYIVKLDSKEIERIASELAALDKDAVLSFFQDLLQDIHPQSLRGRREYLKGVLVGWLDIQNKSRATFVDYLKRQLSLQQLAERYVHLQRLLTGC